MTDELPSAGEDPGQRTITFSTRKKMAIWSLVAYIFGGGMVLCAAMLVPGVAERLAKVETFAIFFFGGIGSVVGGYLGSTLIINGMFKK